MLNNYEFRPIYHWPLFESSVFFVLLNVDGLLLEFTAGEIE